MALTVNTPVVPLPVTFVTPVPLSCGLLLVAVTAYTTPVAEMGVLPSLVTLPPSVAVVLVTEALVGVVTVGSTAADQVRVLPLTLNLPWLAGVVVRPL